MASLYDYGLPQLNQNMMSLYSTMQQEKRLKAEENQQNIINQKNMFELNRAMEQEARLSKPVNASGWLLAQGTHPEDAKVIEGMWESSGLGKRGALGNIIMEARNMPQAIQFIQDNPKNKLAIAQSSFDRLKNEYATIVEEEQNILAKGSDGLQENKKYQEILRKKAVIEKQANIRAEQIRALQKPDTSLTEAEILSLPEGDQRRASYIKGKQGVTVLKPINMPPWFDALGTSLMGSKYNTPEGQSAVSDWVADPKNKAQLAAFQREYAANNSTPFFSVQQTSQGLQPVDVRTGKPSGTPIGNKPLSGEMITAEQQIGTLKDTLGRMEKLYKDDYVGPLAGRVGPIGEKTIGIDPERSQFQSQVAQLQNSLIYLMSGKQINEAEYQRLRKQIPEITLPPKNFKARMDEFKNTVESIISERHKNMGGYGINQGSNETTTRTPQQEADEFFKKYGAK